jgi:predicted flap endonuclease-1-like 5' DNA nuclease
VVEELGGEEALADYEVETEAPAADEAEAAPVSEGPDDLTRIDGVSSDASAALAGAGIVRYAQLASTSEPDARRIVSDAGVTAPDNIGSWAMQASFAANGDWPGLDAYLRASQPEGETSTAGSGDAAAAGGDDLTQLSGIGPKAAEALAKGGIGTYTALAQANEPQVRRALHESDMSPPAGVGSWPMQASFAARGDWQGLMKYNQKRTRATPTKAPTSAPQAPAAAPDDLTQIKGIGPRGAALLSDYGITTYADLEHASTQQLREIVALGGILPPASLDTWPAQAAFATRGDWQGLAAYDQRHR